MLSTDQKAIQAYKKHKGVADTDSAKAFYEEGISSPITVLAQNVYKQGGDIPTTAPSHLTDGGTEGVVTRYINLELIAVAGSEDSFYHDNLRDAIPFNFGDGSYNYMTTVKNSNNESIAPAYQDFEVDPVAGVLRFYAGVPSDMPPMISFYRYTGEKGAGVDASIDNANRTIYVDIVTGSDTNDGTTLLTAFATLEKALDDVADIILEAVVTIEISGEGSLDIDSNTFNKLNEVKIYRGGTTNAQLYIQGASEVYGSAITVTRDSTILTKYAVTGGESATWTDDEVTGMTINGNIIVKSGAGYLYIAAHNQSGSVQIYRNIVTLNQTDNRKIFRGNLLVGSGDVYIGNLDFILGGGFQASESMADNIHIKRCMITLANKANTFHATQNWQGLQQVLLKGSMSRTMLVVYNLYLQEVGLWNTSDDNTQYGIEVLGDALVLKDVIFRNFQKCLFIENASVVIGDLGDEDSVLFLDSGAAFCLGQNSIIVESEEGRIFLENINYAIANISGKSNVDCDIEDAIGVPNNAYMVPAAGGTWGATSIAVPAQIDNMFISLRQKMVVIYPGVFAEYQDPDNVIIADGGAGNFVVGNTSQNQVIGIKYSISRGSLLDTGEIVLTNKADTYISRRGTSADQAGIVFNKNINGSEIRLGYTDAVATGESSSLVLTINRQML